LIDQVVEEIRAENERERKVAPAVTIARVVPVQRAQPRKPTLLAFTKAAG
jgi:hypothetical protein